MIGDGGAIALAESLKATLLISDLSFGARDVVYVASVTVILQETFLPSAARQCSDVVL